MPVPKRARWASSPVAAPGTFAVLPGLRRARANLRGRGHRQRVLLTVRAERSTLPPGWPATRAPVCCTSTATTRTGTSTTSTSPGISAHEGIPHRHRPGHRRHRVRAGPRSAGPRPGAAWPAWFFAYKTAGAAADRGDDLDTVAAIAQRTCARMRTVVGIDSPHDPARRRGEPTFTLDDREMEIGIGIHGEPGIHRGALETADAITDRIVDALVDGPGAQGRRPGGLPGQRSGRDPARGALHPLPSRPSGAQRPRRRDRQDATSASMPPASKWPGRQSLCSLSTMTGWRC